MLIEKHKDKIATILKRYPEKRAALLPLLWLSQEEQGYLSEAAMKEIAGLLGLTPPQVYETVTFYTMLNRQPIGKHHIQVCRSLMCALVGTEQLLGWIHAKLGIKPGQTTPDGLFTLSTGGVPGVLRDRADDAGERRLLRATDPGEGEPHPGRLEARGQVPAGDGALHVSSS